MFGGQPNPGRESSHVSTSPLLYRTEAPIFTNFGPVRNSRQRHTDATLILRYSATSISFSSGSGDFGLDGELDIGRLAAGVTGAGVTCGCLTTGFSFSWRIWFSSSVIRMLSRLISLMAIRCTSRSSSIILVWLLSMKRIIVIFREILAETLPSQRRSVVLWCQ